MSPRVITVSLPVACLHKGCDTWRGWLWCSARGNCAVTNGHLCCWPYERVGTAQLVGAVQAPDLCVSSYYVVATDSGGRLWHLVEMLQNLVVSMACCQNLQHTTFTDYSLPQGSYCEQLGFEKVDAALREHPRGSQYYALDSLYGWSRYTTCERGMVSCCNT